MAPTVDQFTGCLLGLALGDALGAPLEGGPVERALWRVLGRTRMGETRFTDDTQMALDLAESLVECEDLDPDHVAARFARSYRWSRGYGPGAAKLLKRIRAGAPWREANRSVYPEGSFGNGGAMRAPVVGLRFFSSPTLVADAARRSAEITHAHPLGIQGAVAIASATAAALATRAWRPIVDAASGPCEARAFGERFSLARSWLHAGAAPETTEVRARLGTGIVATESCVTAIYLSLRFLDRPFRELIDFIAECGGDTDTIGAMAGAVWGAANGATSLPAAALDRLEGRAHIVEVARALRGAAFRSPPCQSSAPPT